MRKQLRGAEGRGDAALWQPAVAVGLFTAALAAWLLLRPFATPIVVGVDVGIQILAPILGLALWAGAPRRWYQRPRRESSPSQTRLWPVAATLVAVGLLGDTLGQVFTLAYSLHGDVPVPSLADAAFLAMYPVYLAAILLLPTTGAAAPSRGRVALDGALVVAALAICSWPLVLGPTLLRAHQGQVAALVTAAYPLGDLLLLACLLVRWSHLNDRALRPVLVLVTLALCGVVFSDSLAEYQDLHGGHTIGGLADIGWPAGSLLVGLAARTLRRTMEERARRRRTGALSSDTAVERRPLSARPWQALLPYAVLPPAGLALLYAWRTPGDARLASGTALGALTLVTLVVARQIIALLDNTRLYRTLDESQRQLRTVVTHAPLILFTLDREGTFLLGEGQGLQALGLAANALNGQSVFAVYHDQPAILDHVRRALAGEAHTGGASVAGRVFETSYTPLRDAAGAVDQVLGVALDVTERAQAERQLSESEQRYRSLVDHHPDAVFALDRAGRFTSVNAACATISGYPVADLLALPSFAPLITPEDLERARLTVAQTLGGAPGHVELGLRHADGRLIAMEVTTVPIVVDGGVEGVYGIARDVTAYNRAREELVHQAMHDALTGLPNRALLQDRLEQAMGAVRRMGRPCALLLLDLDRFKEINDTFGHAQGDALLRQVAARLCATLRETDTVARLGGDEFAVLLPATGQDGALVVAGAIHQALATPMTIGELSMPVMASLGIAVAPEHGTDAATLLRRADVAMYIAKRGGQPAVVYVPKHDADSADRLSLIEELRGALAGGDLTLYYQPKVELATGVVCGVEALARWPHPTRGAVAPDVFIPLAEQSGLIAPLTVWALDAALQQARAWLHAGVALPIAVNLSVANLRDPLLVKTIADLLRRHDVPSSLLRLELTEGVVMTDPLATQAVLADLAALGIGLSIDDFGTGYSSLAYLKRLPVDELKIDKAFVRHMGADADDAAIVTSTVGLVLQRYGKADLW